MEFEDEHEQEEEEEEEEDDDDEEEITIPPPSIVTPPSYDSLSGPNNSGPTRPRFNPERRSGVVRYRECLKNHAVNIGGHALDGCGEFMPAGEDGTLHALKCAACNCHRNFHRKEIHAINDSAVPGGALYPNFSLFHRTPAPSGYLHVSSAPPHHNRQLVVVPSASHSGEMDDVSGKKRFRTKFTAEQKEKMLGFAEKLGWRIQKHDDVAIQQFCDELQIRRQVLKVWMHNNKHTHANKP